MKCFLLFHCLIIGLCLASTKVQHKNDTSDENRKNSTKLGIVDFEESVTDDDSELTEVQKKRESGYLYNKPFRSSLNHHGRTGYRGRIASKRPHINRPFTRYGLPNYQSPSTKPNNQFFRPTQYNNLQQNSQHLHFVDDSIVNQDIPSSLKNVDFVKPSPIASQNSEPFGLNTANYLPPKNQKLPAYSPTDTFSVQQINYVNQNNDQVFSQQSQNFIQDNTNTHQISDAALFLTQNAQAISQLYGAPAPNQIYAPANGDFNNQNNQIQQQNNALLTTENINQVSQSFPGALPSYASGILNRQETLQRIQSLEKDRLITQLQQALLQSQNIETSGRYAQNHNNYVQDQNFLATIASQFPPENEPFKINENDNLGTFGLESDANTSRYTFSYGLATTPQTPTSSETPVTATYKPPTTPASDVNTSTGSSVSISGSQRPPVFPQYGGFVPTIFTGTNFLTNIPSVSHGFVNSGSHSVPNKPMNSNPTHFIIPIPTLTGQKPVFTPISDAAGNIPSTTLSRPTVSVPVTPVHPVSTPLQPVHPFVPPVHSITTQFRPIVPVNPVAPVHPVVTPVITSPGHPTFGIQSAVVNPVIYKPIKPVYPFYYHPNVALQTQKHVSATNPWNYASTYSPSKTIWK